MVGILTKNSSEKWNAPHMPGVPSLGLNIDRCIIGSPTKGKTIGVSDGIWTYFYITSWLLGGNEFKFQWGYLIHVIIHPQLKLGNVWMIFPSFQICACCKKINATAFFWGKNFLDIILSWDIVCSSKLTVLPWAFLLENFWFLGKIMWMYVKKHFHVVFVFFFYQTC